MKFVVILSLLISGQIFAQKPDLEKERSYRFKEVPKISLKNLQIPKDAVGNYYLNLEVQAPTPDTKKRGPSSSAAVKNRKMLSVSGACTRQDGGIVMVNDPGYDQCLDSSVYVKKVILTDPTQSILMNFNLDGLNFNPFN